MSFVRQISQFVLTVCTLLLIAGCSEDKMTPTQDTPVAVTREVVSIVPGGHTSVQISGGTPPYSITTPPNSAVATATLSDPNASPTTLTITAVANAVIGDNTTIDVGDVDETNGGSSITSPAHGDNEISVFVSISATQQFSLQDDLQPVFTNTCGGAGCHIAGTSAPMSLEPGSAWGDIVGINCTDGTCGTQLRVDPGSAMTSMVYLRVAGLTQCARMPFAPFVPGDTLSTYDQEMIRDWINQGAMDN